MGVRGGKEEELGRKCSGQVPHSHFTVLSLNKAGKTLRIEWQRIL